MTSNFSFSHNVFNGCILLMHQNEYLWSKGLICALWSKKDNSLKLGCNVYSVPERNLNLLQPITTIILCIIAWHVKNYQLTKLTCVQNEL